MHIIIGIIGKEYKVTSNFSAGLLDVLSTLYYEARHWKKPFFFSDSQLSPILVSQTSIRDSLYLHLIVVRVIPNHNNSMIVFNFSCMLHIHRQCFCYNNNRNLIWINMKIPRIFRWNSFCRILRKVHLCKIWIERIHTS